MLSGDVDTLDGLLAVDAVFTSQDGVRVPRADDLAVHRTGLLSIDRLDPVERPIIRVLGDIAIVWVSVDLEGRFDGQKFGGKLAYTRVWQRFDAAWLVAAAHASWVAPG